MNRENIIRMAREAGIDWSGKSTEDVLVRAMQIAYAAGAAAEREACADLCEDTTQEYEQYTGQPLSLNYTCAAAIRARGASNE